MADLDSFDPEAFLKKVRLVEGALGHIQALYPDVFGEANQNSLCVRYCSNGQFDFQRYDIGRYHIAPRQGYKNIPPSRPFMPPFQGSSDSMSVAFLLTGNSLVENERHKLCFLKDLFVKVAKVDCFLHPYGNGAHILCFNFGDSDFEKKIKRISSASFLRVKRTFDLAKNEIASGCQASHVPVVQLSFPSDPFDELPEAGIDDSSGNFFDTMAVLHKPDGSGNIFDQKNKLVPRGSANAETKKLLIREKFNREHKPS